MPVLLIYTLKLSLSLAVVYLFYRLVLRRLTFYNLNRLYLAGYSLLSFFIPFVNISRVLERNNWNDSGVVKWVPLVLTSSSGTQVSSTASFTGWKMIILIISAGMIILLIKLLLQFLSYTNMKRRATATAINGLNIYQVDDDIIPFSFGNSIFINRNLHNEQELQEIIRHEFIHVKQRHSLDIIWSELLCILNWYNPFAWFIKNAIRQNLEFIADNKVVEAGIDKKEYQYLLLKVIGNNQYSIATPFNYSSLKKRIAMMNKLKSTKRQLLSMLFLLPATALLLLAFRNRIIETGSGTATDITNSSDPAAIVKTEQTDTVPGSGKLLLYKTQLDKNAGEVYDILVNKNIVTVIYKNGKKETYNLDIDAEKAAYEKKYEPVKGLLLETKLDAANPTDLKARLIDSNPVDVLTTTELRLAKTSPSEVVVAGSPLKALSITKTTDADGQPVLTVTEPLKIAVQPTLSSTGALTVIGHKIATVAGTQPDLASTTPLTLIPSKEAVTVTGYAPAKIALATDRSSFLQIGGLSLLNEGQYILVDGKEPGSDFNGTIKGTYRISFLDKNEGIKRYGKKGRYGVILAETIKQ